MSLQRTTPKTSGTIDPVHLHIQAMNSLSRCQHMLLANEPMYTFALKDLEEAQKAIAALMAATAMPATQQGALA